MSKEMNGRKLLLICMPIASLFFLTACAQTTQVYRSPKGYDFNKGEKLFLPDALHELSGIAFPAESSKHIFANEDENGLVYYFAPGEHQYQQIKFAKKGDYEGLAISNGYIVVLESKGTVYSFPYSDILQREATNVKVGKDLIPKAEYESLAASQSDSLLYIICKKCAVDKSSSKVTGYVLGLSKEGDFFKKGEFKIDEKQIDLISSLKGKQFRPSALTKNKRTNEWYILSSINKMLVVANDKWEVVGAFPLDPSLFNQPEAIAFDDSGSLYIGNEGGDKANKATLLKFKLN
ncbi:SdiA-regulated domain-containing protein [Sphingobacterium sp. UDSM-2020]|uniref:SdiA-regulated domain-containing protein n=1 Tax=Sphingobacterium sp. UDSM-2020 TaxID=2795738 RepID=UPI001937EEDC|nr:SdiA-regulated domain-containing protein [Sphingobacterium sp. UDSM-2020]QQD13001.1 SdiA-regulated domain-containing protein [Sphingobacterium sp. UDSM-2020]